MDGFRALLTSLLAMEIRKYLKNATAERSLEMATAIVRPHFAEVITPEGIMNMMDEAREQAIAASS